MDTVLPETPTQQKRPQLQFHLCTLVCLSLGAGGFMLANSNGRRDRHWPFCPDGLRHIEKKFSYGFPFAFSWTYLDPTAQPHEQAFFDPMILIIDCGIAAHTLLGTALFCEWSLRRAERLAISRRSG